MEANVESAATLFADPGQYVIPIYQRPYVWDEAKQWLPLWEDIERTAEGELRKQKAASQGDSPDHFLGALVFQDQRHGNSGFHARRVIDGQQRLVTLQLILAAAQAALEMVGVSNHPAGVYLAELVENPSKHVYASSPHLKFKVWPTVGDQDEFIRAMESGVAPPDDQATPIERAYHFFRGRMDRWLRRDPDPDRLQARVTALDRALRTKLKVVTIDLGFTDDPNVIFESLNARGTPLLKWDLAKNHLLHLHRLSGGDDEQLHSQYFRSLERARWWREDVKQGRLITPRLDVFLRYWLTLRTHSLVAADESFVAFKQYAHGKPTDALAADLALVAQKYDELEHATGSSALARFVKRWHITQAHLMTPVLLWLLTEDVPVPEFERCLAALESFLVRRMICRLGVEGLNKDIPGLLVALEKNGAPKAADTIIDELKNRSGAHAEWPSDERVGAYLVTEPLTKLTKVRQRMVLTAIEDAMSGIKPKTGTPIAPSGGRVSLQSLNLLSTRDPSVEPVLPIEWRDLEEWSKPPPNNWGRDPNELRDQLIGSVGNLVLLTHALRLPAANSSWPAKLEALQGFDDRALVRDLLSHAPEDWNEHAILERGNRLAEIAIKIWPPPDKI